jgi:hypothetical protein
LPSKHELLEVNLFLKAIAYRGAHNIKIEEVPEPQVSGS